VGGIKEEKGIFLSLNMKNQTSESTKEEVGGGAPHGKNESYVKKGRTPPYSPTSQNRQKTVVCGNKEQGGCG